MPRGAGVELDVDLAEKAENFVPSSAESHLGHRASVAAEDDNTSASNECWQLWQTYSKIGIGFLISEPSQASQRRSSNSSI